MFSIDGGLASSSSRALRQGWRRIEAEANPDNHERENDEQLRKLHREPFSVSARAYLSGADPKVRTTSAASREQLARVSQVLAPERSAAPASPEPEAVRSRSARIPALADRSRRARVRRA